MTSTLNHTYHPYGAALDLFHCRSSEVLLGGPAGTGKSRACLEKLHLLALSNPGMRGLIVRKTRESLGSTALVTWREHVVKEAIDAGLVWFYGGSAEQPPQYQYANESSIAIGGMDKATKIMSSEYDVAYAQEAIELTENDWESITTRLRNGRISFQQLMADTNPSMPTHWLKQRCDRGDTKLFESRHEDNPTLFKPDGRMTDAGREYLLKLEKLTGVRYLRLRKGLWVAAEGLIYEDFDPAVHVIDRFQVPLSWDRWWSVDFGFTNPFVLQMWARDPDGRLYLYREIYQTRGLVEDHAKNALEQVTGKNGEWLEPRPREIVCDHDAEDRATLERYLGMKTTAARKTVSDGLQAVQSRIKPAEDGYARIYVCRNAVVRRDAALADAKKPTCTEEEIPGYVWADAKGNKEHPVKEDDHGCDAMRYVVAEVDNVGKSSGIQDVSGYEW
jgi:phage terminase large subunit